MRHHMSEEQRIEELAEELWSLGEKGENQRSRLVMGSKLGNAQAAVVLGEMERRELIRSDGEQVMLLPAGEALARAVIRRHRLAEVLLNHVLSVGDQDTESTACQMEHILSSAVTDRICTFLGHPPVCPHGKEIPRGDCCAAFRREVKPLVQPLSDLAIGSEARIVFITPRQHGRLDRLLTLGLQPGGVVRLQQSHPSVVVQAGETTLALDAAICRDIFVLPLER
jgi:DtxR family Mn-dependent transcriptional regulator